MVDGSKGWRGLLDDAQRAVFWISVCGAVLAAAIAGTVYEWWSWYWDVPPELKFGQAVGITTASIVLFYGLIIASHTYFAWPKHHPLHQHPTVIERLVERDQLAEVLMSPSQLSDSTEDVRVRATLRFLEWRDGNQTDSRVDYRNWSHVVFMIGGTNKQRGRAFIEVEHGPDRDRINAHIAGLNWHSHEVGQLLPGRTIQGTGLHAS